MKILYYDCFSGISGDMNLGALLDLGVSPDTLLSGLEKLNTEGWRLEITRVQRHGITGTKVTVITEEEYLHAPGPGHHHDHDRGRSHDHSHEPEHSHDNNHGHKHDHSHDQGHRHEHTHHHPHRNLADIEEIINKSTLPLPVMDLSMKIFSHIAAAEAAVHDKPIDEIHFHEVGALDSIVDIVGAAICLNDLGVDRVYTSAIELGGGMVRCQHGLLPVPTPATARIISGFPVHSGGVDFEATTPTGAAIIAATAEPLPPEIRFIIRKSGYGIGQKNNPARPNMLRVYLAEVPGEPERGHEARLIECNMDDMNPELSEHITMKLFEAGAGDVWITPIIMKKGRPALTLSVICEEEQVDPIREILFTESTTIGLRVIPCVKETLHREFEEVETRFGKVMVKKSYFNDRLVSVKPEADRCAAIAAATGLPMKQVVQEITVQISATK